MNWILIANTGNQPIADYYTLGVTLIAILVIIVGLRGIIRGSRKEDDEEICPRCQNRFWFFHGDVAVECPCVEDSEFKDNHDLEETAK